MKIKVVEKSIDEVLALPALTHREPAPQSAFFRGLMAALSSKELKQVRFSCETEGMERLGKGEPALFLMNHSSFIDLKIASTLLKDRPWHVVCTLDGFVGKEGLMRALGCLPARKFITDVPLVQDMAHVTRTLRESVLLFPEASYSFDGTATPLPESLGKCIRMLKVPVVMIRTDGAFLRDPLYNGLRLRDVTVSARETCLFTAEEVAHMTPREINARLAKEFSFDHFQNQRERHIRVAENFRAEGLERVLYKCPVCGKERRMEGAGTAISCGACGARWTLTEYGALSRQGGEQDAGEPIADLEQRAACGADAVDGAAEGDAAARTTAFDHIPDWYRWERECVRKELRAGTYDENVSVKILILADTRAVYRVGEGVLRHNRDGFHLTGCGGKLDYRQAPKASYGLYADYFWYEIGDMVCIGDLRRQYYCFPLEEGYPVARMRLAAEELYKMQTEKS